jgi:gas vesicle protein GvpL/GvpF
VSGELLWAYCVTDAGDAPPADVERVEAGGLAVLVKRVPRAEFDEEALQRNLNDLPWLERVARAHEAVLEGALSAGTIVPLRLCTLFDGEESVREMLEREGDGFRRALELLAGREEWGVKVLLDPSKLSEAARAEGGGAESEAEGLGAGGAYMLRRRQERETREAAGALARGVAEEVHARLEELALAGLSRPPQNRELSGHVGEMVLNAAYLVEAERVPALRDLVAELQGQHESLGAHIELTGPWPPYNFLPEDAAAVG